MYPLIDFLYTGLGAFIIGVGAYMMAGTVLDKREEAENGKAVRPPCPSPYDFFPFGDGDYIIDRHGYEYSVYTMGVEGVVTISGDKAQTVYRFTEKSTAHETSFLVTFPGYASCVRALKKALVDYEAAEKELL